jgi:hypothetical protein
MKLHSLVLAAALSGMFGNALAGTFDIGLVGNATGWTTDEVGTEHAAGAFTDTYTFSDYSAASSIATGSLISTATNLSQLVFTSASLNGTDLKVSYHAAFGISSITFDSVSVTGPLTLVINGIVKAKAPGVAAFGSYGGDFKVTSAVPEPAAYGMLLGVMGVLAFAARRRKQ